ncbi:MAG: hypothetical protein ACRBBM_00565 [Pseudomonadaceae bacterium]
MDSFDKILLRFKEVLGVHADKEVASLLDMKPTAFNARKKRAAFPEEKLYALAARRPDLVIPVEYILTGKTAMERFTQATGRAPRDYMELTHAALERANTELTRDERELVELFRAAPLALKAKAVELLSAGVQKTKASKKSVTVTGNGNRTAGRDFHEEK